MTKELSEYVKIKDRLVARDKRRNKQWSAYDAMWHTEYELPEEVKELAWVRTVVSSDPHDAIAAGDRTLSTLEPGVKITPTVPNAETKMNMNAIERNLRWQLRSANRRRSTTVESDVVRSALLYMGTACTVVDLDHHIKIVRENGGDPRQLEETRKVSRFIVTVYNPQDVHTQKNRFGNYGVLLEQVMLAEDVAAEWGLSKKPEWQDMIDAEAQVRYFDYTDHTDRAIWVEPELGGEAIEIMRKPHGLPFINWVAILGGTDLEGREENKFHPLLYTIEKTKQWETQNIVQSLYVSETIAKAAQPDFAEEGSNPDNTVIDYEDPTRNAKVPAGNTLKPLPKQGIPQGMAEVNAQMAQAISKSTVSQVLMGGQLPSGTAFSTVNTVTQTALAALNPAKRLAEQTLAEIFISMVKWVIYTDNPLLGYGYHKDDMGTNYVLTGDMIDEESLYLEVNLKADVPTDRLQRANAANLMKNLGYPKWKALEELGSDDPDQDIFDTMLEEYVQNQFQNAMEQQRMEMQNRLQLQFQQAQMAMQAQFQQMMQGMQQGQQQEQMQAQAMQAQQQQQMQAQQEAELMAQQGNGPFPGGQGFDPSRGGTPTAQAFPEATREQVTGEDMSGNPLAELGGGMS